MNEHDQDDQTLSQTDHFILWRSQEEEGYVYHLELGGITLHLDSEEWEELVTLVQSAD